MITTKHDKQFSKYLGWRSVWLKFHDFSILCNRPLSMWICLFLLVLTAAECQDGVSMLQHEVEMTKSAEAELVVPIYQWPAPFAGSMYEEVSTTAVKSVTVLNPGNGLTNQCQGTEPLDPVWLPVVTSYASNPLARTIGYVYSQWGSHSLDVVKQSIDNYFQCFDVRGIFVDETATDPNLCNGNDAYYDQLYAYVKAKDPTAEVMCNPGTGFDYHFWKHCCDRAMVVEVSLTAFNAGFKPSGSPFLGPTAYPRDFSVVLVYGVPAGQMAQTVARATCHNFTNAGGIWVLEEGGDGVLPTYTTMPSYWQAEVQVVKTDILPECPAPPNPTQAPTGGACWWDPSDLNCEICNPGYVQCSWSGCYKRQCAVPGGVCDNPCFSA